METLQSLLEAQARLVPERPALLACDGRVLSFRHLADELRETTRRLAAAGVNRGDRVAIALPNGPDAALSFLGVAGLATAAPLNPAYGRSEFDFYLRDLSPRLLITDAAGSPAAVEAAQALGIPILPFPLPEAPAAGLPGHDEKGQAAADDVALVLHTSGTTSRPKIVPLTHANLVVSARNIAQSLGLANSDRCLNVMPLFHIHGLVAAVLASLAAGGSVVCTPGFNVENFLPWCREFSPTWYTAVPTMHQAVVTRLAAGTNAGDTASLRFARSCSSALAPSLMASLEAALNIPVVEAYGMTEASHQMATNPLPPRARKPGSVGIAAGTRIAVMDATGKLLPAGETGEVVIQGGNVTRGYESPPEANATAFVDGWFRTGDQGRLDAEGYLFLTGRLKEIINRGGEKIAPREIDEALLECPGVAQAVAFALPHPTLGEDLAVAVVPRAEATLREEDVRDFAYRALPAFKVPSAVVVVDAIPKGPTGKLQRIGLAEKLKAQLTARHVPPTDEICILLADIWSEVLGVQGIGLHENFFALGGDSLRGARVAARVNELFCTEIPVSTAFRHPTIDEFSRYVVARTEPARLGNIRRTVREMQALSDADVERMLAAGDDRNPARI